MPTASRAPGDGELRLCRWDSGWCNSQLPSASVTREELRVPDSPHEVGRTGQRQGGTDKSLDSQPQHRRQALQLAASYLGSCPGFLTQAIKNRRK